MPDADHAAAFWADVARTFADDDGVVLEPYNEPFPDGNRGQRRRLGVLARRLHGQPVRAAGGTRSGAPTRPAGMQAMVDAIRGTGSRHVILLGGIQYSNALTQWLAYQPRDPLAASSARPGTSTTSTRAISAACWDWDAPAAVAAAVPLVATEIGEDDCMGGFITPLMQWLDAHGGLPGLVMERNGACTLPTRDARQPWSLITDYTTGTPNGGYAQAFRHRPAGRHGLGCRRRDIPAARSAGGACLGAVALAVTLAACGEPVLSASAYDSPMFALHGTMATW